MVIQSVSTSGKEYASAAHGIGLMLWALLQSIHNGSVWDTETQSAALFPPHQHACHFWVSASVVLSFFHFHVCICVERMCVCWMYVAFVYKYTYHPQLFFYLIYFHCLCSSEAEVLWFRPHTVARLIFRMGNFWFLWGITTTWKVK